MNTYQGYILKLQVVMLWTSYGICITWNYFIHELSIVWATKSCMMKNYNLDLFHLYQKYHIYVYIELHINRAKSLSQALLSFDNSIIQSTHTFHSNNKVAPQDIFLSSGASLWSWLTRSIFGHSRNSYKFFSNNTKVLFNKRTILKLFSKNTLPWKF